MGRVLRVLISKIRFSVLVWLVMLIHSSIPTKEYTEHFNKLNVIIFHNVLQMCALIENYLFLLSLAESHNKTFS